jgi:transposase
MAVVSEKGKVQSCRSVATREKDLVGAIVEVSGPKSLVFEEGQLAAWLSQLLRPYVNELVVSDPRENRWIAGNEKKNDRTDAIRLAQLLRTGMIKPVYHSQAKAWVEFRSLVQHHEDLVRHVVRTKNQLKAHFRSVGIPCQGSAIYECTDDVEELKHWLGQLRKHRQLQFEAEHFVRLLGQQMQLVAESEERMAKKSRQWPIIGKWDKLPGVGLIVASTVAAIVMTPQRFSNRRKLVNYAGLGVAEPSSGGKILRKAATKEGNRDLKRAVMQAAASIARMDSQKHALATYHQDLTARGLEPLAVQRSVARKLLCIMYGQWKRAEEKKSNSNVAA